MAEQEFSVSASIYTSDPEAVARAAEVLGRAIAGLALDGINSSLNIIRIDDEK